MKFSANQIASWCRKNRKRLAILSLIALSAIILLSVYTYLRPDKWKYYTDGNLTFRQLMKDVKPRYVAWEKAAKANTEFSVSGDIAEPAIAADGTRMVFTRGLSTNNADLFMSRWDGEKWTEPAPLRALNSNFNEIGPSISHDGQYLYFSTDRPGGQGGYDIWVARWDGAEYAWPLPLTLMVNTPFDELGPHPTPDGEKLFFSSNKPRRELADDEELLSSRRLNRKFADHDQDLFMANRIPAGVTNREIERAMSMLYSLREAALSDTNVMCKLSGTSETEKAVDRSLAWLASKQEPDGRWSIQKSGGEVGHDVAATAFALLAFYGRSERHDIPCKYQDTVSRGIKWLVAQQDKTNGDLRGKKPAHNGMYDHGIASLALAEAYGLTKDEDLYGPTQSAIDFLVDTQNGDLGGWRYQPNSRDCDTSVSGWAIMALKSAELSGLAVPERTFIGIRKWLKRVSGGRHGGNYGYDSPGKSYPATKATGYFCSQLMGLSPNTPKAFETAGFLKKQGVLMSDVYYAYYGTLASYQNQGSLWRKWMGEMQSLFLQNQQSDGSWLAQGNHGARMGAVIFTSLVTLSLQAHYRYTPLYGLGYEPPEKPGAFSTLSFNEIPDPPLYRRAKRLSALSSPEDDVDPVVTEHGDFLYFASARRGGMGGLDIYRSRLTGMEPGPPENIGPAINTAANETAPSTRMAGFNLIFSSDRNFPDGRGLYSAMSRQVFRRHDYSRAPGLVWFFRNCLWRMIALVLAISAFVLLLWKGIPGIKASLHNRFLRFCERYRSAIASVMLVCMMIGICASMFMTLRNTVWCYFTDDNTIREAALGGHVRKVLWSTPDLALAKFNVFPSEIHEPAFSPDGMEVVFTRGREKNNNADLFISRWDGHVWSKAEPIEGINRPDSHEISPAFSADGRNLYFVSDRAGGLGRFDIFMATRDRDKWSSITNLGEVCNSEADDLAPGPSADGHKLYFCSNRGQESGRFDIYAVILDSPTNRPGFAAVRPVGGVESQANELYPDVTRHDDLFYFVSDRRTGPDNSDLYVARVSGGEAINPRNVGRELNTKYNETCPALRWEGFDMLFSSNRDSKDKGLYRLYATTTREVVGDIDLSRWYAFVAGINKMKWWFLLAAVAAVSIYYLLRNWSIMTSLLQKCLIGSVIVHLVILLITAFWVISRELSESVEGTTMEVSIDVNALAREKLALDMQEQVAELPPSEVNLAVEQIQQDVALPEFTPPDNMDATDPIVARSSDQSMVAKLTPSKEFTERDDRSAEALSHMSETEPLSFNPMELETFAVEVTLEVPERIDSSEPEDEGKKEATEPEAAQESIEVARQKYDQPSAQAAPAATRASDVSKTWTTNVVSVADHSLDNVDVSHVTEAEPTPPEIVPHDLVAQFRGIETEINSAMVPAPSELKVASAEPVQESTEADKQAGDPSLVQEAISIGKQEYDQPVTDDHASLASKEDISRESASVVDAAKRDRHYVLASVGRESKASESSLEEVRKFTAIRNRDDIRFSAPERLHVARVTVAEAGDREYVISPDTIQRDTGIRQSAYDRPSTAATMLDNGGPSDIKPDVSVADTGGKVLVASAGVESRGRPPTLKGVGDVATMLARSFDTGSEFKLNAPGNIELPAPNDPGTTISPQVLKNPGKLSEEAIEGLGGSGETQGAISHALDWLSRAQEKDGRWSIARHGGKRVEHDVAATSLALLCYYGWGASHNAPGPHKDTVKKATRWLLSQQQDSGYVSGKGGNMYDHGMAAIALSEGYSVSHDPKLRVAASNAVYFIAHHQNARGGWRYGPTGDDVDLSVLGWQFMALASARMAGLDDAQGTLSNAMARAEAWLDTVAYGKDNGEYGYNATTRKRPAMTATGMFCRQLVGTPPVDPRMQATALYLRAHPLRPGVAPDAYYMYYATLALYQHQGRIWQEWNERMKQVLVALQDKTGPLAGSWPAGSGHVGREAGRLVATTINILSLEVYYRILPMYGFRSSHEQ